METRTETITRMEARSTLLKNVFAVLLIVGLIGSLVLGYQAGRSIKVDTGLFVTLSSTDNTTRGVTVFFIASIATLITTVPLLALSWVIAGQADLLRHAPDPDPSQPA